MARLSDSLTRPQQVRLESGELEIHVDLTPAFPGCYIVADLEGRCAAGSSARLAIEGLERQKG